MKNRRHTPEQIIRKLAEGDKLLNQGQIVEEVARHLEITEATWYRWRNQYGGMKADDAKKLRELRPRSSWRTGESTTTSTGLTAHTAGSPRSSSSKPGSTNNS
jgi:putative transposase